MMANIIITFLLLPIASSKRWRSSVGAARRKERCCWTDFPFAIANVFSHISFPAVVPSEPLGELWPSVLSHAGRSCSGVRDYEWTLYAATTIRKWWGAVSYPLSVRSPVCLEQNDFWWLEDPIQRTWNRSAPSTLNQPFAYYDRTAAGKVFHSNFSFRGKIPIFHIFVLILANWMRIIRHRVYHCQIKVRADQILFGAVLRNFMTPASEAPLAGRLLWPIL